MTIQPPHYGAYLPDFGAGAKNSQKEYRLQVATADYLKGEIHNGRNVIRVQAPFPGLLWTHPANETKDATDAHFGKRKGVRAGVADILSWYGGKAHALELKVDGYLSREQKKFMEEFREQGGETAVCKSVKEVRDFYIAQGLECKNMACLEPNLLTEADLKRRYWESQAP